MRFFTVPDGIQARRSAAWAMGIISYFQLVVLVIGLGAIVLLTDHPQFTSAAAWNVAGGNNMAAIHLSQVIGGNIFMGFICAVAFATILAVVSGLMLSAATTISHDLFAGVIRKGACTDAEELRVSRLTVLLLSMTGILYSPSSSRGQNVAVLATLPLVIAASANFPVLLLFMYWKGIHHPGRRIRRIYRAVPCRQPDNPGSDGMGKRAGVCGTADSVLRTRRCFPWAPVSCSPGYFQLRTKVRAPQRKRTLLPNNCGVQRQGSGARGQCHSVIMPAVTAQRRRKVHPMYFPTPYRILMNGLIPDP